ncbi:ABC transporter ATP-binding protein [Flavilitoribacter nigricans]|uniref:ABC transporter ATP-binding protein n=1 Tax=Flavilitoribacter nigricans (strain ATCC 23147 / DSM 23189 / NBRC 102662 / NCIMB 1420 / SS-2) TaxID=1122177 RepID=A0A2D0NIK1_FLAN2|nr:ABC transporter ATP-binding protein [Flavilitoribacter nigricans]PHN08321.1 ABC transporter ATP-binding protein [Flavilitoribacter nigricans DSM 23189 = NBRC 102662]
MKIELEKVAKRYRREWILRKVDLTIEAGKRYAIEGPNGSGKSTLLRILSGHLTPSKGKIRHLVDGQVIDPDQVYRHLSYAAPYIELIEELTLAEALRFHRRFKEFLPGLDDEVILELLSLPGNSSKLVRHFSSGMKQRLKLALALCSDTSFLLLDEPTTNLDQQGIDWYLQLVERFAGDRTVVVASNVAVDFGFCEERFSVLQYKKS